MKSRKQIRRPRNKSKKFRKMKKGGGERENRLLLIACDRGNTELAMALVDRGADVDASDEFQMTPLHWASYNGHMEVAMALMDRGANVDARDDNQKTPLHDACAAGHMEVAMALVDRGADVDARSVDQCTPLHIACMKGNMEVAMALVDRGADVNARNWVQTPLDYLSMENRNRLESMINRNVGNVMSSMIQRTQEKDSARRISELPEEIGRKVGSYLGGKRKTKKRKTRRRKTRKH